MKARANVTIDVDVLREFDRKRGSETRSQIIERMLKERNQKK